MKNNQSKLLWIPRSLVILNGMFFLYLVFLCLLISHRDLAIFSFMLLVLVVIFIVSFLHSIICGGFLILYTIYFLFSAENFNSFVYYPIAILLIAGIMMIVFSIFPMKNSSLKSNEQIQQKKHKSRKTISYLLLGIFSPIVILICFFVFSFSIAFPGRVTSGSMSPTIRTNAFLLINRMVFNNQNPRCGDIIQFSPVQYPEAHWIKRVIGLPGDTIEWKDYNIYINGKKLFEPYEYDSFTKTYKQTNEFPTLKLKDNEYFVMGDNRMISYDGRYFDPVKRDTITGKVYFIHNPPEDCVKGTGELTTFQIR